MDLPLGYLTGMNKLLQLMKNKSPYAKVRAILHYLQPNKYLFVSHFSR